MSWSRLPCLINVRILPCSVNVRILPMTSAAKSSQNEVGCVLVRVKPLVFLKFVTFLGEMASSSGAPVSFPGR